MKTESTIMPATVERYPGLVRINYDVKEKVPVDVPVDVDVPVMYEYRMVEIRGDVPAYDKLTELLVTDKYPLEEQVRLLESGDSSTAAQLALYKHECRRVALEVLGLPATLAFAKEGRCAEVMVYDSSPAVNSFEIRNGGVKVTDYWIGRDLRTSLEGDVRACKDGGHDVYLFDIREMGMTLPLKCDAFLAALNTLREYAVSCFNQTSRHLAAVAAMESLEEVEGYDYTTGYPERLVFDVKELM